MLGGLVGRLLVGKFIDGSAEFGKLIVHEVEGSLRFGLGVRESGIERFDVGFEVELSFFQASDFSVDIADFSEDVGVGGMSIGLAH